MTNPAGIVEGRSNGHVHEQSKQHGAEQHRPNRGAAGVRERPRPGGIRPHREHRYVKHDGLGKTGPGQVLQQIQRQLPDREDKHEVEEELKRSDFLLPRVSSQPADGKQLTFAERLEATGISQQGATPVKLDGAAIFERWLDTRYLTGKSAEEFKPSPGLVADTLEIIGNWKDLPTGRWRPDIRFTEGRYVRLSNPPSLLNVNPGKVWPGGWSSSRRRSMRC